MVQTVARGRQAIVNGYLSFVGATTPDAIRAYLRHSKHWSDGLWARFALVGKPETLPAFQMDTESYEPPAQLIEHLRAVALVFAARCSSSRFTQIAGRDAGTCDQQKPSASADGADGFGVGTIDVAVWIAQK